MDTVTPRVTVGELLELKDSEGRDYIVSGSPTGLYADRASYGNRPMLALVLEWRLPCKANCFPYSTKARIGEGREGAQKRTSFISDRELVVDSEDLGVAAAMVNSAIRDQGAIEVHGKYVGSVLEMDFLLQGNMGFRFEGYKFPGADER